MFSYSKILPILIIVCVLSFSVRLTALITGVSDLSTAHAESNADDKMTKDDSDKMMAKEKADKMEMEKSKMVKEVKEAKVPKWRDAGDSNLDISTIKLEMFEDLSRRRQQIETAEQNIQVKEALLKAAEQELDQKVTELSSLKQEIERLLELQSDEEQKRITSLVKIYEGMKPKDAARIFDTLDLDVLIAVMSKMSERKVAPVLAAMNPERARTITIMMAEKSSLPEL